MARMTNGFGSAYILLFPSLGGSQGPDPLPTICLQPAQREAQVPAVVQCLCHPTSPQARPPLISGVLMASKIGGDGASLESEDWLLQSPLVMMESSLPLASSSLLSGLVSPFIVSCERVRMDRAAVKQGLEGAAYPQTSHLWFYALRPREALGHRLRVILLSQGPHPDCPHRLPPSPNSEAQDLVPCDQAARRLRRQHSGGWALV